MNHVNFWTLTHKGFFKDIFRFAMPSDASLPNLGVNNVIRRIKICYIRHSNFIVSQLSLISPISMPKYFNKRKKERILS